ncbi:MAG: hypothetical protein HY231_22100 [Acidobacteria bacterium]|nr:hypothetical protein [Acidobacteriota bacterium]
MRQMNFASLLQAARQLPDEQRQQLIDELRQEIEADKKQKALEAVARTRGRIKGLDRETIIWLAEDEELCGY